MAGPRYTDWTNIRVLGGDQTAAAKYVPQARKLLGYVFADAQRNNLGVHQITRELSDGAILVAEKHGSLPRITITPPPASPAGNRPQIPSDFVVWARNGTAPDGIDAVYPQQLLRVNKKGRKTFFYESSTAGHADYAGAKGVYAPTFPAGVRFAGNVDWKGPKDERVSWYGPSTRYWYDPHIKPRQQYGKFVFLLGQKLLDVEQYIADSDPDPAFDARWVMGAALDGNKLYVVHAALPDPETDMTPAPANSCFVDAPWPVGDVTVELCTYAVAQADEVTWTALSGSRTVLWSGVIANALNPWFFNESVTAAVSIGLPDSVLARIERSGPTSADDNILVGAPSSSQQVHTFRVIEGGATMEHADIALAPNSTATIAADFAGDTLRQMTVRRYEKDQLASAYALRLGSAEWELCSLQWLGLEDPDNPFFRVLDRHSRHIMFADIRTQTVVLAHTAYNMISSAPHRSFASITLEVWRAGERVESRVLRDGLGTGIIETGYTRGVGFAIVSPGGFWYDQQDLVIAGATVAPCFPLYQTFTCWQLEPRYSWQGAHGLNAYLAYPAAARFGAARFNGYAGNFVNRIDDLTDESGLRIADDFDANNSVLGCATGEDTTMLSCYNFEFQTGKSASYVSGSTLAALTGVDGDDARYHPIWLLGKPPVSPA